LSKATHLPTSLFLSLVVLTALVAHGRSQAGGWFYWMEPGTYATLAMSAVKLPDIPGWSGSNLGRYYSGLRFPNETQIGFRNITLTWKVLEVYEDEALVNYTIELFDAYYAERYMGTLKYVSSIGNMELLSLRVLVKMDTLNVYSENGTYIGRWPFWVHGHEVGSRIVMVHDVLTSDPKAMYLNGTIVITHLDAKVGLSDSGTVAQSFGRDPESEGINTTFGFFSASRLLGCTPVLVPMDSAYISAGPDFPALYDKVSLTMVAYSSDYIDDVVRFMVGDIYIGIYLEKPLVIVDSNIDFSPEKEPDEPLNSDNAEPLLIPSAIAATVVVVSIGVSVAVYAWKKKRG